MKKILLIFIFSGLTINSFACICWFSPDKKSVKSKIAKADIILYATVVADSLSENFQRGDSSLHVTEVIFQVVKIWKGKQVETIRFKAKRYPCEDAGFKIGERYIIFGYINPESGNLETNNCTSLSENTIPDPDDKIKMQSKDFDAARFERATLQFRQEFESVKKQIERSSKTR
jgi:hypothetical protein